jgi:hypothetical protein
MINMIMDMNMNMKINMNILERNFFMLDISRFTIAIVRNRLKYRSSVQSNIELKDL